MSETEAVKTSQRKKRRCKAHTKLDGSTDAKAALQTPKMY